MSGKYSCFTERKSHQLIASGLDSYLHITSPIRRLVDLLNMIILQHNLNLKNVGPSDAAMEFYTSWIERLDFINLTMRSVRKVQSDCSLLHMYVNDSMSPSYSGCIFDKTKKDNERFSYMVYITEDHLSFQIGTSICILGFVWYNFSAWAVSSVG